MVAEWQFENCIELLFTTSDLIFCVFFLNGKMVLICPVEMASKFSTRTKDAYLQN
jgi:hypothetical protein